MNIFRQLRWRLTLNYALVTVGTLLAITLVLGGILLIRIFQAEVYVSPGYSPTNYIDGFMNIENESELLLVLLPDSFTNAAGPKTGQTYVDQITVSLRSVSVISHRTGEGNSVDSG